MFSHLLKYCNEIGLHHEFRNLCTLGEDNTSDKKIFIQHIVLVKGLFFYQACMVLATSIEKREGKKKEGVEWPGFHTVGIDLA